MDTRFPLRTFVIKVNAFLPVVDELVTEGLVTLEAVRVVRYVSPENVSSVRVT